MANKAAIKEAITSGTTSSHPGLLALHDLFNLNPNGSIKPERCFRAILKLRT